MKPDTKVRSAESRVPVVFYVAIAVRLAYCFSNRYVSVSYV